jgi:predicted GNAT family N-acyltransferase
VSRTSSLDVPAGPKIRPIVDHTEFLAALAVRIAVFVGEQGGPVDEEPDSWDDSARHFVILADGRIVGTARLYQPQAGAGKIGRVALLAEYRGRGWGDLLIRHLLDYAGAAGFREVVLDAQTYAVSFYKRFGFAAEGEEFHDAGIPHRRMRLRLQPPAAGLLHCGRVPG